MLPYGDSALLVETVDPADVLDLAAVFAADAGVLEVVPAARTVLVRCTAALLPDVRRRVDRVLLGSSRSARATATATEEDAVIPGAPVVIEVRYDGADLASTAAELHLDVDGLVRAHTAGRYVVAFCGFVPGFAYLTGLDPALHAPRLADPRPRVPAGSVAVAGEFTGVYPRESPGGWRLLGTTRALLWEAERAPPALLPPGTTVRFRAG